MPEATCPFIELPNAVPINVPTVISAHTNVTYRCDDPIMLFAPGRSLEWMICQISHDNNVYSAARWPRHAGVQNGCTLCKYTVIIGYI